MDIEVKLKFKNDKLTCVYPKFNENDNTWKIEASPDNIHIYFENLNHILNKIYLVDLLSKQMTLKISLKKN